MTAPKYNAKGHLIGKRGHNPGRPNTGAEEDSQLVTGPHSLIQAMRELAVSRGESARETWRKAAAAYLKGSER